MASRDDIKQAFRQAVTTARIRNRQPALMGKPTGASTWDFEVTAKPGWVYVRILSADGTSVAQALNLSNVPRKGDLQIWVDVDDEGQYITDGLRSYGTDTTVARLPVYPAFGVIYCHEAAASQNFTGTPSKFSQFAANGDAFGVTVDHTADSITIITDGVYMVSFNMLATLTNGTRQDYHIRVDAVETNYATGEYGNGSPENIALPAVPILLTSGEVVTIYGESTGATVACAARHAQLVVQKVAELY